MFIFLKLQGIHQNKITFTYNNTKKERMSFKNIRS